MENNMATKLGKIAYNKILLQAEEARDLGFDKLSNDVFASIGSIARDEQIVYNEKDLRDDVSKSIWKIAMDVIAYHDLKSIDIQQMDEVINELSDHIVANIENGLGVLGKIGALEEKLPGEK
jgi:hypothetical protein